MENSGFSIDVQNSFPMEKSAKSIIDAAVINGECLNALPGLENREQPTRAATRNIGRGYRRFA